MKSDTRLNLEGYSSTLTNLMHRFKLQDFTEIFSRNVDFFIIFIEFACNSSVHFMTRIQITIEKKALIEAGNFNCRVMLVQMILEQIVAENRP